MRKGISTILIIGITVVVMGVICAALYYFFLMPKNQSADKTDTSEVTDTTNTEVAKKTTPYLIYAETVSEVNNTERSWPTINIYRTTDGVSRELLATVGKVGEYPGRFSISPDHSKMLIGLEKKLQILDLETKQLTDLLTAQYEIGDSIFSKDSQSVLVWDQKYTEGKGYSFHRINLATKQDTIIKTGTLPEKPEYLTPYAWRDDSKVAMMEPLGEAVNYWYFDLETLEIGRANIGTVGFATANGNHGKLMAVPAGTIADVCNEMSATATNAYDIIDNISGAKSGSISVTGSSMTPVAFSPDDTQLLFYTEKPVASQAECSQPRTKSYYKAIIASGASTSVTDVAALLKEWQIDNIGASYSGTADGKTYNILLNDKVIVTTSKPLQIISQYWK